MDINLRPAEKAAVVTPSDSVDLTRKAYKGLWVGVAGAIKVTTVGGSTVTFTGVPVGLFPVAVKRVWATGTTATTMLALS